MSGLVERLAFSPLDAFPPLMLLPSRHENKPIHQPHALIVAFSLLTHKQR